PTLFRSLFQYGKKYPSHDIFSTYQFQLLDTRDGVTLQNHKSLWSGQSVQSAIQNSGFRPEPLNNFSKFIQVFTNPGLTALSKITGHTAGLSLQRAQPVRSEKAAVLRGIFHKGLNKVLTITLI